MIQWSYHMPARVIKLLGLADDANAIGEAAAALRDGQIVIVPTETVYGAAALLTHVGGMEKLQKIRGNSDSPPTLHIPDAQSALRYVDKPSELASRLMSKFWPGPVGLVFKVSTEKRAAVAAKLKIAEAEIYRGGAVALRCPDHAATTELLRKVEGPVVAIGAGGQLINWADKVDLILDAGPTQYSRPSTLVEIDPKAPGGYRIIRAGVYDERIIEKILKTNLLFVCSGNTCRSPMAEALAKKMLAEKLGVSMEELPEKGFVVGSAGVVAMAGTRAAAPALAAMEQMGANLSGHRSRPLTPELIHQADAIFVMGNNHRRVLLAMSPAAAQKVHLLDSDGDIEDPIGGDVSLYLSLAERLNTLITQRLAALKLL